jgi:hypothetical protein
MKKLIFSLVAAIALLTTQAASAQDRPEAHNDNYGYDKNHQVTPEERARWEAAHKDGRKDDRRTDRKDGRKDNGVADRKDSGKDARKEGPKDDRKAPRKDDRRDDRKGKDTNYGFDKNHQVTPEERARWEEAHKTDSGN